MLFPPVIQKLLDIIRQYDLGPLTGRYHGFYLCQVVSTRDAENRGRVKVSGDIFPGSKSDDANDQSDGAWCFPVSNYSGPGFGMFLPPEVGSFVLVGFLNGDWNYPFYIGGIWTKPKDDVATAPWVDKQTIPPTIRGIKTLGGWELKFIEQPAVSGSKVPIDQQNPSGKTDDTVEVLFILQSPKGQNFCITDTKGQEGIAINDFFGNQITLDTNGIKVCGKTDKKDEHVVYGETLKTDLEALIDGILALVFMTSQGPTTGITPNTKQTLLNLKSKLSEILVD
jgi:hypothetical protein